MKTNLLPSFNKAVLLRKIRVDGIALVALTILGPFGTYHDFCFFPRAAYWAFMVALGSVIFEITVPGFLYHQGLMHKVPRILRFVLGVLVGSFFVAWGVFAVENLVRGPVGISALLWLYLFVTIIAGIICFVSFMPPFAGRAAKSDGADIDFERIAFFQSYPHLNGERLRWISMEDHYARVVTERREVLLHVSMQKLERQLQQYPGMRVHRSHWVAHASIQNICRVGRTVMIEVDHDTQLPLGGTYQKPVERAFSEMTK